MLDEYSTLLTVQEACDLLMVGKNTIYELIKTQKIKGFRTGRIWKIPKSSMIEYILTESGLDNLS